MNAISFDSLYQTLLEKLWPHSAVYNEKDPKSPCSGRGVLYTSAKGGMGPALSVGNSPVVHWRAIEVKSVGSALWKPVI